MAGLPKLLSIFLLLGLNAFFVAAEFSILSVRRSRIRQLALEGDDQARTVESLQRTLHRLLSTTQLGITLSSLALGWIGESTVAVLLRDGLQQLPLPDAWRYPLAHTLAVPLAFLGLVYVQIVFGELFPKALALLYPEQLARLLATPSLAIGQFFNPFIWVLNQSTSFLLGLAGIEDDRPPTYSRLTPEELQLIISTTSESIGLEEEERTLLNNVFEFGDVTAEDVMIPRTQIVALSQDLTLADLLQEVAISKHSRYPLLGDSLDDVRGIVCFKELAPVFLEDSALDHQILKDYARPVRFVPEYMFLSELLPAMQRSHQAMVIVVDEHGGTAGLITLEDVVEEIIGESPKNTGDEVLKIEAIDSHTFLVPAALDLDEVNDFLDLAIPLSEEYNSLGGFLIYSLQKIPQEGESFTDKNITLTLERSDGPRLDLIRITVAPEEDDRDTMDMGITDLTEPLDNPVDQLSLMSDLELTGQPADVPTLEAPEAPNSTQNSA